MSARRFRYALDPLCLVACALYALNRWVLKPAFPASTFLHGYLADVLLIPAALPLVLWLQRRLAVRTHDAPPNAGEVAMHLAVWAILAEGVGHFLLHHGTADGWDLVAYSAGAVASFVWWRMI